MKKEPESHFFQKNFSSLSRLFSKQLTFCSNSHINQPEVKHTAFVSHLRIFITIWLHINWGIFFTLSGLTWSLGKDNLPNSHQTLQQNGSKMSFARISASVHSRLLADCFCFSPTGKDSAKLRRWIWTTHKLYRSPRSYCAIWSTIPCGLGEGGGQGGGGGGVVR